MFTKEQLIVNTLYEIEIFPDDWLHAVWDGRFFRHKRKNAGLPTYEWSSYDYDDAMDIRLFKCKTEKPAPKVPAIATKHDEGKPRPELIPPEVITALSTILSYGAEKYDARNWEKGMSWNRVFGSLMRHMWAWFGKEKVDPETGKSHLWHAACNIAFLIAYESRNIGEDDRVESSTTL